VLPLQDRCAEPGLQFFVDGMTDALIAELSRVQALRVISPTSVMRYLGTTKTAPEIASELGVDALLEGSVMLVRGTVRVQAHLIDPVSDRHVWSGDYDRPTEDVLVLNRDIARAIVDDIHVQLSAAERAQLNEVRSVMPGAHALWLQGRYLQLKAVWTPDDYERALDFFEQSAALDPEYAPAYVGQADMCHRLGGYGLRPPREAFGQAKVAGSRALALDDALPGAHAAVAFSRWLNDWDYKGAEREFLRAMALGSQEAIHQYGSLLSLTGRHDEAVAAFKRALTVNPFSTNVHWGLGMVHRMSGQLDRSAEVLRAWLSVEPGDAQALFQLAVTLVEQTKYDDAVAILDKMVTGPGRRGFALGALAYARGRRGDRNEARRILGELQELIFAGAPAYGWMAIGHMGIDDHAQALDALAAAIELHDSWVPTFMCVEPAFVSLREHPRFQALCKLAGHAA
jgi:TolB-like protein/tetratricopeptide (TPR) repeat protein